MIAFYIACVIISVLMTIWYFIFDIRRSIVQNLMLLLLVIGNLGYLSLALQTDLGGAILSCKIYYLCATFLPLLYFFTVCEVCNVKLKSSIILILTLIQTAVFGIVCTVGYKGLYYSSVDFEIRNGICLLIRQPGPLYSVHPITVCIYFVASLTLLISACIRRKTIGKRNIVNIIICETIVVVYYILDKVLDVPYEFIPICYVLLMFSTLVPIYEADIFAVVENEEVINDQLNKVGFISFDKKLRYKGANACALALIKNLKNERQNYPLSNPPEELQPLLKDIEKFCQESRKNKTSDYHMVSSDLYIDGRTFETQIHSLKIFKSFFTGVTVELRDITDHVRVLALTEKYNEELNKEVNQKTAQIMIMQEKTILGMAQMVESRDLSTGGHIKRTSDVVRIFAKELVNSDLHLDEKFLKLVIRSAPMHDLGKIGVDDAILRKQGKFTDAEYEIMKKHPQVGSEIVRKVLTGIEDPEFIRIADNVAHYHHEKVNGKGYPCGLKGDEIPIEARIMALADVFDALVSRRCYKDAFSYEKAFTIIQEDAGSHFDENLVPVFLKCRSQLEDYYNNCDH